MVNHKLNILISGAGGFIGSHLTENLSAEHTVIRILSKKKKGNEKDNDIIVNLLDDERVEKTFVKLAENITIDVIIHLASKLASTDQTEDVEILTDNIKITNNIIRIAKILSSKIFINFSSMAVYPNIDGVFSEKSEIMPSENKDCLYGLSKYCSEELIDFLFRNNDIRICHLRVSQVYGDGMRKDRIIPTMQKELADKNAITLYGNGERISNFIKIEKLVKIIKLFIHENIEGVYNIGEENISYFDLAKRLIANFGNHNSVIKKIDAGSKEKFVYDTSKLGSL